MNELQLHQYAATLRAKEAEMLADLTHRDGLAAESEPDLFDEIQNAVNRALVVRTLDRCSALLREIRTALTRIEDGNYGRCLRCEVEINSKRLAAVPWTPLCLACQEEADREGEDRAPDFEILPKTTACRV